MTLTRSGTLSPRRRLALALALAMLFPPCGGLLSAAQAQDATPPVAPIAPAPASAPSAGEAVRIPVVPATPGPIHTILLFPFANEIAASSTTGGFNADIVGARVEDAVKLRLNVIGRYKADSFSPTLPQIKRALLESGYQGLTDNDITPPYDGAQKGEKIAAQIGTDGFLIGTIEALDINPTTRNVNLTVSASLYSTETGAAVKTLAYTGHGISYNANDDPASLLQSAVNDVAGHIVSALNAAAPTPAGQGGRRHGENLQSASPVDYKRGGHSNGGSILLGLLLATGVGLAISSSNHHGNSSNSSSTSTSTGVPAPPTIGGGGGPPAPP